MSNISLTYGCNNSSNASIVINCFLVLISFGGLFLNFVVFISFVHISYPTNSQRFIGIRRSKNINHPIFGISNRQNLKTSSHKLSSTNNSKLNDNTEDLDQSDIKNNDLSSIVKVRSPSFPGCIASSHSESIKCQKPTNNYRITQLNIGRTRSYWSPPKPRGRITTALFLVFSLVLADFLNSTITLINLFSSLLSQSSHLWTLNTLDNQLVSKRACFYLILSCFQFTAYNAALLSLVGLSMDLYLGTVRPMQHQASTRRLLIKYILCGWILSICLGSHQLLFPAIKYTTFKSFTNLNTSLFFKLPKHFLMPSEPCTYTANKYIMQLDIFDTFCYQQGSKNVFRAGFFTALLLVISTAVINFICVYVFKKIQQQQIQRTLTSKFFNTAQRSTSLPSMNRLTGVVFSLHGQKTPVWNLSSHRYTYRQLFRNLIAILSLLCCFTALFTPSLVLEMYTLTKLSRGEQTQFPSWIYDLLTNLPVISSVINPLFYSLRFNDIHNGLKKARKRLFYKSTNKKTINKLRLTKKYGRIFSNTNMTSHFRIRMISKKDF